MSHSYKLSVFCLTFYHAVSIRLPILHMISSEFLQESEFSPRIYKFSDTALQTNVIICLSNAFHIIRTFKNHSWKYTVIMQKNKKRSKNAVLLIEKGNKQKIQNTRIFEKTWKAKWLLFELKQMEYVVPILPIHKYFLSISTFPSFISSVVMIFIFPFSDSWYKYGSKLPPPLHQIKKLPYINPQKMLMSMYKPGAYIQSFTVYSKVVRGTCANRKSSKF